MKIYTETVAFYSLHLFIQACYLIITSRHSRFHHVSRLLLKVTIKFSLVGAVWNGFYVYKYGKMFMDKIKFMLQLQ